MSERLCEASAADLERLWPVLGASRIFEDLEGMLAVRAAEPWRFLLNDRGDMALLQRWRRHLDIAHIRAAWCHPKRISSMIEDVRAVAAGQGLHTLVSPLLETQAVQVYVAAGLTALQRLVAYQLRPGDVRRAEQPAGIVLRPAAAGDLDALTRIEESCFSAFWRHEREEIRIGEGKNRVTVAEGQGEVVGYTLTTLSRGSATLGRVAVLPSARGRGVGRALVTEAADSCLRAGVDFLSLCTQESNAASRALYGASGFEELPERLVFAADPGTEF